jgi:hypothetical protein
LVFLSIGAPQRRSSFLERLAPRRAPENNAILRFPVTYRGQILEVEIGLENVKYT